MQKRNSKADVIILRNVSYYCEESIMSKETREVVILLNRDTQKTLEQERQGDRGIGTPRRSFNDMSSKNLLYSYMDLKLQNQSIL